ncbi:cysteine-rich motor neuron 1 protein-like [Pyxicephalus adspersus]|uniref:cysteine-rich motor neuron 1 protein-like n=1 Tax=Pyxicephalus adspersus TaxID=30357 RepID=UPI003B5CB70F
MRSVLLLLIVCFCWKQATAQYNCTACDKRKCRPHLSPCPRRTATDPCGCGCHHCAKGEWELCGGPDWEYGYCDRGTRCANLTGLHLAEIPDIGVCKELPDYPDPDHYAQDDDENCPEQSGCYKVMGMCDCVTKRTCFYDFTLSSYDPSYCIPQYDDPAYDHSFVYKCTRSGCDLVDDECVCTSSGCDRTYQFPNRRACYNTLMKRRCANVTCPEEKTPVCPKDSVPTRPYTPYGSCCPTVPSFCTCNFQQCDNKCPNGKRVVIVQKADGKPGSCCDLHLCVL